MFLKILIKIYTPAASFGPFKSLEVSLSNYSRELFKKSVHIYQSSRVEFKFITSKMWSATSILSRPTVILLYINDLTNASNFDTTLFADDTLLMLADKCPDFL